MRCQRLKQLHFGIVPTSQRVGHFPEVRAQFNVDYLVDCIYEPTSGKLFLLAGDNSGTAVMIETDPTGCWERGRLQSGHVSTIRCCTALRSNYA
jgi:hypothetical protein